MTSYLPQCLLNKWIKAFDWLLFHMYRSSWDVYNSPPIYKFVCMHLSSMCSLVHKITNTSVLKQSAYNEHSNNFENQYTQKCHIFNDNKHIWNAHTVFSPRRLYNNLIRSNYIFQLKYHDHDIIVCLSTPCLFRMWRLFI